MGNLGELNRALKPDGQAFDEVRISTIPRFKDSELSGSEWRISAKVEFFRKGNLVHTEESFRNIEVACNFLPFYHAKAQDDGYGYFAGEGDLCDQEGCKEKASVTYKVKNNFCNEGKIHDESNNEKFRMFCERHKKRGDSSFDDSDVNYEKSE